MKLIKSTPRLSYGAKLILAVTYKNSEVILCLLAKNIWGESSSRGLKTRRGRFVFKLDDIWAVVFLLNEGYVCGLVL